MLIRTLLLLFHAKQLFKQYYLFTHNIELLNSKLWVIEQYRAYVVKKCIYLAFYPSQPSCDIVLHRPWHQNSDRCPNRHNSVQMQWLWLCCYFQLETINNLETRSGKYIWQFSNNKSTCLTFINHKTVKQITNVFPFSELFRDDLSAKIRKSLWRSWAPVMHWFTPVKRKKTVLSYKQCFGFCWKS